MTLVIVMCGGVLALLVVIGAMLNAERVTDQDIKYIPWILGGILLFILGDGVIIRYLLNNPIKNDGCRIRSGERDEPKSTLHII